MKTWWRIGTTIEMTDDEIEILKRGNEVEIRELLWRKWNNGNCMPDGDTYMPDVCAEEIGLECGDINVEM